MDAYYSKKGPKVTWAAENLGIMRGGIDRNGTARNLFWLISTGVGAAQTEDVLEAGQKVTIQDGLDNRYTPISSYKFVKNGPDMKPRYAYSVDAYLEVGFIYDDVSQEELKKIQAWQEETGIQVLYPLIAENEYTYHPIDTNSANFWFKSDA
jgi:hypothetical protein